MRRIAIALTALGIMVLGAGTAQGAVLSSFGGTVYYIAGQGERNDVVVGTDRVLGLTVYTFTDADANPIQIGGGVCELINGVGSCSTAGIHSLFINVRDRDDTAQISTSGGSGLFAPLIPTTIIGGRGVDVLTGGVSADVLKGNNGRDTLRGRQGPDVYKGGRGSDTLQTLDGQADTFISCGNGRRDLVRADKQDPKPKSCELGGRKPGKQF